MANVLAGIPMPDLGGPHRDVVVSVAAEIMTDRLPMLTERVVRLVIAREPAYAEVPVDDVRRWASANCRGGLQMMVGSSVADDELAAPFMTGRRRARQGVPLESMLHAFHLGGRIMTEHMLSGAQRRSPLEPLACLSVARAAMVVSDAFARRHSGPTNRL